MLAINMKIGSAVSVIAKSVDTSPNMLVWQLPAVRAGVAREGTTGAVNACQIAEMRAGSTHIQCRRLCAAGHTSVSSSACRTRIVRCSSSLTLQSAKASFQLGRDWKQKRHTCASLQICQHQKFNSSEFGQGRNPTPCQLVLICKVAGFVCVVTRLSLLKNKRDTFLLRGASATAPGTERGSGGGKRKAACKGSWTFRPLGTSSRSVYPP